MKMTSLQLVSFLTLMIIGLVALTDAQSTPAVGTNPCGSLTDPENGMVVVAADTATYTCNNGFELVGEATRSCTESNWDGAAPTCQQTTTARSGSPSASSSGGMGASSTSPMAEPEPEPTPEPTSKPSTTDDEEGDMDGDMDNDSQEGNDMNDKDGLRGDQIALAVLATILSVATLAFFIGLAYWKFYGTSYVTVSADTTYLK